MSAIRCIVMVQSPLDDEEDVEVCHDRLMNRTHFAGQWEPERRNLGRGERRFA